MPSRPDPEELSNLTRIELAGMLLDQIDPDDVPGSARTRNIALLALAETFTSEERIIQDIVAALSPRPHPPHVDD